VQLKQWLVMIVSCQSIQNSNEISPFAPFFASPLLTVNAYCVIYVVVHFTSFMPDDKQYCSYNLLSEIIFPDISKVMYQVICGHNNIVFDEETAIGN